MYPHPSVIGSPNDPTGAHIRTSDQRRWCSFHEHLSAQVASVSQHRHPRRKLASLPL